MQRYFLRVAILLASTLCLFAQTKPAADLIIRNAKIWTVDRAHPEAEAVAILGDRIVMGAVAPVPWRVQAAERVLAGKTITEAIAVEAANAALAGAKPMTGNAYKIQIAKTAVKRAVLRAAGIA